MKFGVPWGVKKIRPEARETAKEAARRSGMSLEDWLDSVILRQAQHEGISIAPRAQASAGERGEVADLNQRLDELTRRIEQITRPAPKPAPHHGSNPGPAAYAPRRRHGEADLPPPAHVMAPPLPSTHLPPGLDHAVAEISARRRALNGEHAPAAAAAPPPQMPMAAPPPPAPYPQMPMAAPAVSYGQPVMEMPLPPPSASFAHMPMAAPAPMAARPAPAPEPPRPMQAPLPSQNLSGLEDQLRRITDQIETLRKPGVEEAISALRRELGEIGRTLAEALPRNAIEAIEKQILEVAMRIDEGRQAGVDQSALARIEQGLGDVRDALHGLTPAESLVGFNDAVASLAHKIDLIIAQKDPATLEQLEHAITTLRGMADHVASNEAVTQLANEVVMLGEKIDYIARTTGGSEALNNLDQRVAALASALGERGPGGEAGVPPRLESLVQSLGEKIERIQSSKTDAGGLGHLEQRIAALVERLDASQSRLGQLETIERGLADLLTHMEDMKARSAAGPVQADSAPAVIELKQNMNRTQDALEAVHGTLGHVVDRLAMIEKEFRNKDRKPAEAGEAAPMPAIGKLAVRAVSQQAAAAAPAAAPAPAAPAMAVQSPPLAPETAEPEPVQPQPAPRRRVATSLATVSDPIGDQPIEPGSGPPKFSARIAASEAALAGAMPAEPPAGGKSTFIAAARRAAQAAMKQGTRTAEPPPEPVLELQGDQADRPSLRARLMKRMKSVFIAASIIAVVVGGFQIAGNWLKFAEAPEEAVDTVPQAGPEKIDPTDPVQPDLSRKNAPAIPQDADAPRQGTKPVELQPRSELNAPATPSLFSPPVLSSPAAPAPQAPAAPKNDVTGSLPEAAGHQPDPPAESSTQEAQLPAGIGSARLRNAAISGDPGAAYEVAVRFAEGQGVRANMAEAAYWFGRAASRGLVPAQFRYASMLEKGQGVKKDANRARDLYLAAAAKGNAKAMHNLAVLYAEGFDGKPDYSAAVKWFRLAAKHGIADSQYNLGVLTARGLGTEKDYAESYKWFALAASQGDQESAKKRDEIAGHLDAPLLAAAQQATEAFAVDPQPKAATTVPKPQGGWDTAAALPAGKSKSEQRLPLPSSSPLSLGSFAQEKR